MKQLYYSSIYPYLTYAITSWGSACKTRLNRIRTKRNKCTRYRIMFKILLIRYKALNNLAPSYIRDLLIPYISSCQQRSSSKNLLSFPHFNLRTYGARSFSVAVSRLWNTLPSDIKNSPSMSVFKNRLKTFLFKKNIFITFL